VSSPLTIAPSRPEVGPDAHSTAPATPTPEPLLPAPGWEELVAVGLVAGDLTPAAVARYSRTSFSEAREALARAREASIIDVEGRVSPRTAAQLIARLPTHRIVEVHASVARRVLSGEPEDLRRGLHHLREAAATMVTAELVALADHAGRFALDIADAEAARDLLLLALEHDLGDDLRLEAERNLALSRALSLLGDPDGARSRLLRAMLVAEGCGATDVALRAAERFALPADWQAGDARVVSMIERVQRMHGLTEDDRVRLLAIRAWVEARLPLARAEDQQVAWIGRPNVARPLAVDALAASTVASPSTRLLALLAWRHTHRAPQFLADRRAASTEALAIAEQLGAYSEQVEAAVLLAVDALESGDRTGHAAAITTATAVAGRSGDEHLRWRALTSAAGAALMDGDVARARELAGAAFAAGTSSAVPGLVASQWTFTGHLAARHGDLDALDQACAVDPTVIATSPLGRAGLALLLARAGQHDESAAHAWGTLHQLDEESSLLLTLSRLADAAVALEDAELAGELAPMLVPWSGRIVVDANGWWCDGPVDLWLGELELLLGREPAQAAGDRLHAAAALARSTGDVRSGERIAQAIGRMGSRATASTDRGAEHCGLTAREREVLRLLASGSPYHAIARQIRYSVSTVRNDAMSIYRKLGVSGRSAAAARAVTLGLDVGPTMDAGPMMDAGPTTRGSIHSSTALGSTTTERIEPRSSDATR
jgi:DNA-binding CsgD family transcriptional regulator